MCHQKQPQFAKVIQFLERRYLTKDVMFEGVQIYFGGLFRAHSIIKVRVCSYLNVLRNVLQTFKQYKKFST